MLPIDPSAIRDVLERAIGGDVGKTLRKEDRKKARELEGFLPEIARALAHAETGVIVDAAAGRGWVGLAALALLAPQVRAPMSVCAIERDPRRAALAAAAGERLGLTGYASRTGELADEALWPARADLVIALHACGSASDDAIDAAVRVRAPHVLIAPCCVARRLPVALRGEAELMRLGLPSRGAIRRHFVEAFVLGARTLKLESHGYHTELVAFAPDTVTPYNVVLRGRLVNEPVRRERAVRDLARLLAPIDSREEI